MNALIWPFIVLAILVGFKILEWVLYFRRQDSDQRNPVITDAFGNRIKGAQTSTFKKNDQEFRLESFNGSPELTAYHTLTLMNRSHGDFYVSRIPSVKNWHATKSRWTFVLTGDEEFDQNYNVQSQRTPKFTRNFFQDPSNRELIEDLFHLGFSFIRHDGKGLDCLHSVSQKKMAMTGHNLSSFEATNQLENEAFEKAQPRALPIIQQLAKQAADRPPEKILSGINETWGGWLAVLVPTGIALILFGGLMAMLFAFSYQAVDSQANKPEMATIIASFVVFGGGAATTWRWLGSMWFRGRQNWQPLNLGTAIIGVSFSVVTPMLEIPMNVVFDTSPIQRSVGRIVDVTERGPESLDQGWDVYYIRLNQEQKSVQRVYISTSRATDLSIPIPAAKFLEFQTREGALDKAYYVSFDTMVELKQNE